MDELATLDPAAVKAIATLSGFAQDEGQPATVRIKAASALLAAAGFARRYSADDSRPRNAEELAARKSELVAFAIADPEMRAELERRLPARGGT